jgi:hypothetical protein
MGGIILKNVKHNKFVSIIMAVEPTTETSGVSHISQIVDNVRYKLNILK